MKKLKKVFNIAQSPDSPGEFYQVWELLCFLSKEGNEIAHRTCSRFEGPSILTLSLEASRQREHSTQPLLGKRPSASNYHARKLVTNQGNHSNIITLQKLPTALSVSWITGTHETNQFLCLAWPVQCQDEYELTATTSFRIGRRHWT